MWISEAWLVGLAVMAAAMFVAAFLFGVKAGCVYGERMTRRVGINPKWVASLDARQQLRDLIASSDAVTAKELQAKVEAFEKSGGWTDFALDGEAAQDVLRQLDDYFGREVAAREMTDEAGRIGFRPPKAKAGEA
jgi:hypothetical protein